VISAAKADVDAATRPAATIALMKFTGFLHLGDEAAVLGNAPQATSLRAALRTFMETA
jgi:hypothetical protein